MPLGAYNSVPLRSTANHRPPVPAAGGGKHDDGVFRYLRESEYVPASKAARGVIGGQILESGAKHNGQ